MTHPSHPPATQSRPPADERWAPYLDAIAGVRELERRRQRKVRLIALVARVAGWTR